MNFETRQNKAKQNNMFPRDTDGKPFKKFTREVSSRRWGSVVREGNTGDSTETGNVLFLKVCGVYMT